MSQQATISVVVLFQDELVAAAVALERYFELCKAEAGDEAVINAARTAFEACWCAIYPLCRPEFASGHVTVSMASMFVKKSEATENPGK